MTPSLFDFLIIIIIIRCFLQKIPFQMWIHFQKLYLFLCCIKTLKKKENITLSLPKYVIRHNHGISNILMIYIFVFQDHLLAISWEKYSIEDKHTETRMEALIVTRG